tara:strand:- start:28 stop:828 length:801 start_codon:yes stop_codon:yes gene_type:complete
MAKKQTKKAVAIEEPVVAVKQQPKKKDSWEVKDRVYFLKRGLTPLTYTIKSRGIYYFDEEKGYERELKYTLNQKTVFVDEFKGDARLGHIVFENGTLNVPREKQTLQKLLSLYHPERGSLFAELDLVKNAEDDMVDLNQEIDALNMARDMDVEQIEAILRVEQGSSVSKMTTKELKRDALVFARNNPSLFIELANDENVKLRNFGIKCVELGLLKLSSDNRSFTWANTGRKLLNVPFDEHPYSALAAWFKTDEGLEAFNNLEKRLK